MDDFGSGYSSLNMLKSMPVDFIKIDRGFLNEVVTTERGKTVIRFSISLAREMSIKVIAEGVETEEQAAFLLQAGCAYAQGYFYSRPCPSRSLRRWPLGQNILSPSPRASKPLPKNWKKAAHDGMPLRKHASSPKPMAQPYQVPPFFCCQSHRIPLESIG